ncbi:serine/threonine-protein kinase-like protein At3g51990 [Macadamia integrifolia]|uniref:serine/threonine-protein kinase-like protein At3g51990 n=1 Tax=Macadamia integrifolia TaxID=60698 RepID=UPI001C4EBC1F|nr:serine/threonine-protein kinase-like protein At3g51990 [Macadamia integrifolia]
MGYCSFSCNAESAIAVCDSYNFDRKKKKQQQKCRRQRGNNVRKFSYIELESATGGFSPASFLGKGSHGIVYRAPIDGGNLIAAVKKTTTAADNNPADNEIEILSRIKSHRLVNLLGYSLDPKEKKLLVVEFMPNGSLYDLLHSNPRPPGWSKRVRFALQTAKAVETLHSSNPPVIHRDIKSSNVLLDGKWNARLGDFGLALRGHVEDVRIKCTPPAGTLGYLDPGYIAPENLSTKSDVFSFGILLLEIISGRNAIDMKYSPPSVVDWALPVIQKGNFTSLCDPRIGPPEDPAVVQKLAVLAARCVAANAEKRPAMAEVVGCLNTASKRVNSPVCGNIRWRVTKSSPALGAQVFDDPEVEVEVDVVKSPRHGSRNSSMRSRRASSVQPIVDFGIELNGSLRKRGGRSKSIGSVTDLKMESDGEFAANQIALVRRRSGVFVKMPSVKLNKSKSMGVMQARSLEHNGDGGLVFQLVMNPCHFGGSDESRPLMSVDEVPYKKVIEKKQTPHLGGFDDSRPHLVGFDDSRPLISVDKIKQKKLLERK